MIYCCCYFINALGGVFFRVNKGFFVSILLSWCSWFLFCFFLLVLFLFFGSRVVWKNRKAPKN